MDTVHYGMIFVSSFVGVGLRAFQSKNVIHNKRIMVVPTSMLMSLCDVVSIGLIAKSGLLIAIPAGVGAGLGVLTSMFVHDRIFKNGRHYEKTNQETS